MEDAGQPSNGCLSQQARFEYAPDQTSNAAVEADPFQSTPAPPAVSHRPSGRHAQSALQIVTVKRDETDAYEASRPADMASQQLHEAKLDHMSRGATSEAGSEGWRQANGHSPQESSPDRSVSMDKDDATLLVDMQGFACALGCDWQVWLHAALAFATRRFEPC